MYEVDVTEEAKRGLRKAPVRDRGRIYEAIDELSREPRHARSKKLGGTSLHRVRVGDWRVIYEVFDRRGIVAIVRVVRRSESTYRDL